MRNISQEVSTCLNMVIRPHNTTFGKAPFSQAAQLPLKYGSLCGPVLLELGDTFNDHLEFPQSSQSFRAFQLPAGGWWRIQEPFSIC